MKQVKSEYLFIIHPDLRQERKGNTSEKKLLVSQILNTGALDRNSSSPTMFPKIIRDVFGLVHVHAVISQLLLLLLNFMVVGMHKGKHAVYSISPYECISSHLNYCSSCITKGFQILKQLAYLLPLTSHYNDIYSLWEMSHHRLWGNKWWSVNMSVISLEDTMELHVSLILLEVKLSDTGLHPESTTLGLSFPCELPYLLAK